jgi:hypothetical protein
MAFDLVNASAGAVALLLIVAAIITGGTLRRLEVCQVEGALPRGP